MRNASLRLALGALLLVVVAAWTISAISPPEARGSEAPPGEFSAARAFTHVQAIAKAPHPVGSPAHDEVRAYILGVLAGLSLETRVEESRGVSKVAGVVYAARVANVIARLPGTRPGPAILLAAHYDSVPHGLGASDDGSGVATLLETARALKASPRLETDVVFLFTDAEEIAATGALAFTSEELAKQPIAVALNFEARGTRGPVALYDTSENDGALIDAVAASAPRVVSTSLLGSLARALPNDSDATLWKRAGIPTLAFAYVDHLYQYHHYTDSPEALDLRSLQHDGDYALPLVRQLATAGPHAPETASRPVAYFDVFGRGVVSYSLLVARVLAVLTLGVFGWLVGVARRARPEARLTVGRVTLAGVLAALALVATGLSAWAVHALLRVGVDPFVLFAKPFLAMVAALAAGVAGFLVTYGLALARWRGPGDATLLVFGGLSVWAGMLLVTAAFVPAASFVFQWPLLFALGGTAVWLRRADAASSRVDLALVLGLVPATFFWSYVAYTLYIMLGPNAPEVAVVAVAFPLLLALPVTARVGAEGLRRLGATAALTSVAIAALGGVLVRRSPDLPRPDVLEYTAEANGTTARWSTGSKEHDAFVAQKIPVGRTWIAEPAFPLAPAKVDTSVAAEGGLKHGTIVVTSARRARCFRFWEVTQEPIVKALIDDRPVVDVVRFSPEIDEKLLRLYTGGAHQAGWVAEYCGAGDESFKIDLYSAAGKPVKLRMAEITDGLPGPPLRPRSATDGYPDSTSDQTSIMQDLKL